MCSPRWSVRRIAAHSGKDARNCPEYARFYIAQLFLLRKSVETDKKGYESAKAK